MSNEKQNFEYVHIEGQLGKIENGSDVVGSVDDSTVVITLAPAFSSLRNQVKKWAALALGKNYKIAVASEGDAIFPRDSDVAANAGAASGGDSDGGGQAADSVGASGGGVDAGAGAPVPSSHSDLAPRAVAAVAVADGSADVPSGSVSVGVPAAGGRVGSAAAARLSASPSRGRGEPPDGVDRQAYENGFYARKHPKYSDAPDLDPALGTQTPAFQEWLRAHGKTL